MAQKIQWRINEQTAIKQTMDFRLTLAENSRFQIKVKPAENYEWTI